MLWNVRVRMAGLVRVKSTEKGIVHRNARSWARTSFIALAASAASRCEPCTGIMTRSARLIALPTIIDGRSFQVHNDKGRFLGHCFDYVDDRILRDIGDDREALGAPCPLGP